MNFEELCGIVSAILFTSDRPVSIDQIKSAIDSNLELETYHQCLKFLQDEFERPIHGSRIVEIAGGFQMRTKSLFAPWAQKFYKVTPYVLSPVALEVLAIVAYQQPIDRSEIDRMRGVDSSHILRVLMDKKLIKWVGRSEEMGRPTLYGTTYEFLETFGLNGLTDLPPMSELEALAQNKTFGEFSEIQDLIGYKDQDNKKIHKDELTEIEEDPILSQVIQIKPDTPFLKELKGDGASTESAESQNEILMNGLESEQPQKIKLSPSELMEKHILQKEIREENKLAVQSSWPVYLEEESQELSDFEEAEGGETEWEEVGFQEKKQASGKVSNASSSDENNHDEGEWEEINF
jgi:segregation and condensation protein B